jgi:hypothetical protein
MKFRPKDSVRKFQMGGDMAPAEEQEPVEGQAPAEEAPAEQGGQGDPLMQVAQLAA